LKSALVQRKQQSQTDAPVGKDLKSVSAGTQDRGRPEAAAVEQVAAPRLATGVCKVVCPGGKDVTVGAASATGIDDAVGAAGAAVDAKVGGDAGAVTTRGGAAPHHVAVSLALSQQTTAQQARRARQVQKEHHWCSCGI